MDITSKHRPLGTKDSLSGAHPLKPPHGKDEFYMHELLFFLIGFLLGGLVGITVMCLIQINRVRKEENHESQKY